MFKRNKADWFKKFEIFSGRINVPCQFVDVSLVHLINAFKLFVLVYINIKMLSVLCFRVLVE